MHSQITKGNGNLYTWPKIVQGPASGTRRTRINSASFTILSARKCFKYPTKSSADLNCDIDDAIKGVDNPVPRCKKISGSRIKGNIYIDTDIKYQ